MTRLITKIKNTGAFIRNYGIVHFIIELSFRSLDSYHERRLNVVTKGMIKKVDLKINNPNSIDYVPMEYTAIYSMLKKLPIDKSSSVFLDYGSGKGRAVVVAATFHFKKVVGIEISEQLVEIAKRNIDRMKYRKTSSVEIKHVDATAFSVPPDVNMIYFFNPFIGGILQKVVWNIYLSYKNNPRKLYIIFLNNDNFERILRDQDWLSKTYQTKFHSYSCGIYETISHRI